MESTLQPLKQFKQITPQEEAARILQICNACRYCEGFCAVFPAMTRRLDFLKDVDYLANLCHNCGACLYSCQYAAPHEFAVNIPRTLAQVRKESYQTFAWPESLAKAYDKNGTLVTLASSIGVACFLIATMQFTEGFSSNNLDGNFYRIFPHNTLALIFGLVFVYALIAMGISLTKFWRSISQGHVSGGAIGEAGQNVLTLKYLGGGHGEGCNNEDDAYTLWRRRMHHFTFYGFLLCFASTSTATIYHYFFDWHAPYPYWSLPVILGSLGGVGLIIGTIGLFYLNLKRHPDHGDPKQKPMDRSFILSLLFISLSGMALLIFRQSNAMAFLLALHLGFVMGLFLTLPYGKMMHGFYRSLALLKNAIEKRQKNPMSFGSD
jgi:citrate/tricarballylate utilization protein